MVREPGRITTVKHHTYLQPNSRPAIQHPYRAGLKETEQKGQENDRMLNEVVREPTMLELASSVLVSKKDGQLRFCVEYRKCNAKTVRDIYPLLRMEECIDFLRFEIGFSTVHCNSGYWHIEILEADREERTVPTHHELLRPIRFPFGMKNVPASFERAVDNILSRVM